MAIIKVSTSVFSTIKTVERAVDKANRGDEIQLASGKYKESLTINQYVTIYAKEQDDVLLEGIIIIPKDVTVSFNNLTIQPTVQIYVEGKAIFKNCTLHGQLTSVILSLNGGFAKLSGCTVKHATDVGLALLNDSSATIRDCVFEHNGKAHILLEQSAITMTDSECHHSKHAFWIKTKSRVQTENVKLHRQTGTQVIVQNESQFSDIGSTIEHGSGNGIYATKNSVITLHGTSLSHHQLPQLWIQLSNLEANNCDIQHGMESGIMLREHAEAELNHCIIAHHKIANVQATVESRLNMTYSQVHSCEGVGVQVREKSIVNFIETTFAANVLSQLFVTENSICTLKDSVIKEGRQVGIFIEKSATCAVVDCIVAHNANTAMTAIGAELTVVNCEVINNKGNGILAVNDASVTVDLCKFFDNGMPHIAGKTNAFVSLNQCEFIRGKSIYMLDNSSLYLNDSKISDGEGVQIEVADRTKARIKNCQISNGTGNAIKALRDSTLHIHDSQISKHRMPQIVVNDSSLIFKNSELLEGDNNGFIIENNSEALIQDSFITKHLFPQVWIDLESTVELKSTLLTEGAESDIYVQNKSSVYTNNCIIRNDKFNFNVQAVNHSKIDLYKTTVENTFGEKFYSENNSFITQTLDEVN
ncbi:right-handed parallel beta-helix repeat-containing protein [Solibacillus sp. FSL H8-0538]|uniref:right-handed parallel beta-helix repeat-containing protein n=1 Tax=Solibacillus sp. FSL H8-0538 TaxID=2921400 RepID=UPI0030F72EC9